MVRHRWGKEQQNVHFRQGESVESVLAKLLNDALELRDIMFEARWEAHDSQDALWMSVRRHYHLQAGWRVQLNGKNLAFHGGFAQALQAGDALTPIFTGALNEQLSCVSGAQVGFIAPECPNTKKLR